MPKKIICRPPRKSIATIKDAHPATSWLNSSGTASRYTTTATPVSIPKAEHMEPGKVISCSGRTENENATLAHNRSDFQNV
jgi:hypothetical protein